MSLLAQQGSVDTEWGDVRMLCRKALVRERGAESNSSTRRAIEDARLPPASSNLEYRPYVTVLVNR